MTEYSLCANDPIYFINNHVIKLKPFQEELIEQIHQHPSNLINSARQMGVTTVLSAYILWLTLFTEGYTSAIVDVKLTNSIGTLERLKHMHEKLPEELRRQELLNNKREWKLNNNSGVFITSTTTGFCSKRVNLTTIDNAAFINNLDEVIAVVKQASSVGGKIVIASTLYKPGWFTDRCIEAEKEESDYNYIKLPYYLDTKKKRLDRMHAERILGEDMAKVEFDCTHYLENDVAKPLIDE